MAVSDSEKKPESSNSTASALNRRVREMSGTICWLVGLRQFLVTAEQDFRHKTAADIREQQNHETG